MDVHASLDSEGTPVDPLLTCKEASRLLGISNPTFLRRVADGVIPKPLKLGALSRWPKSEILAVIETAKAARDVASFDNASRPSK